MEKEKKLSTTGNLHNTDLYQIVVEHEKKQARSRDPNDDAELYIKTCNDIRKILGDICQLKCAPSVDLEAIDKSKFQACVLVSLLKKLNRLEKVRLSTSREAINVEKQNVESKYMQYQNLLYEVHHYNSEYNKCMQYKSIDQEIDLVSTTDFLKNASDTDVEKFSIEEETHHELYLARLDYELKQRIHLSKLLGDLKEAKKEIKDDIVNMKKKLAGVEPKLQVIVAATKPLQEHLGMTIGEVRTEHKLAVHLPDPLYLFYCNADAYGQFVNDDCVSIEIDGNLEDVEQYNEAEKALTEDSDHEQDMNGDTGAVKKHRRRKAMGEESEDRKKNILLRHPLCVKVTVKVENISLILQFNFLPHLRIVTVIPTTKSMLLQSSPCVSDVLSGESILNQLYTRDTGIESPNLVNNLQLKQIGIDHFHAIISRVGYAYNWAQKLCGLEFLNCQNFENRLKKNDSIYLHTVEKTITTIKHRLKMRASLASQLLQLEQNIIPAIPKYVVHPNTSTSTLTNFTSVVFQRFCQEMRTARTLLDSELITADDLYFLATITHSKAMLTAWIVIKNEYPEVAPMIFLHMMCNGDHHSENSEEIRDMECHVNADWTVLAQGNEISSWLLAVQLKYLCSFLDVYLETGNAHVSPSSTVFFRKVLGRNRRRPYKFHKAGNGIFTHY